MAHLPSHGPAPSQRLALPSDAPRIAQLMRRSVLELFPPFYDERQTASAAVHIARPDPRLVEDGTYVVHEVEGEIVGCGGWSRRHKLYTGSGPSADDDRLLDPATEPARIRAMFVRADWVRCGVGTAILEWSRNAAAAEGFRSLILMAMLPGVPLYRSHGFVERQRTVFRMPDGVSVDTVLMDRPVADG